MFSPFRRHQHWYGTGRAGEVGGAGGAASAAARYHNQQYEQQRRYGYANTYGGSYDAGPGAGPGAPLAYRQPHVPLSRGDRAWMLAHSFCRNLAIAMPAVLIVVDINLYASSRGRWATDGADETDPVFLPLFVTLPLVQFLFLSIPFHFIFGYSLPRYCYLSPYRPSNTSSHISLFVDLVLSRMSLFCRQTKGSHLYLIY